MYTLEFESVELECQEEELTEFQFKDSQHSDNITSLILSIYSLICICSEYMLHLNIFPHIFFTYTYETYFPKFRQILSKQIKRTTKMFFHTPPQNFQHAVRKFGIL